MVAKTLWSTRLATAVFAAVLIAGGVVQRLATTLTTYEAVNAQVLKIAMYASWPAVLTARFLSSQPSFPRALLWPAFWSIQLAWAALLGALVFIIRRGSAMSWRAN